MVNMRGCDPRALSGLRVRIPFPTPLKKTKKTADKLISAVFKKENTKTKH